MGKALVSDGRRPDAERVTADDAAARIRELFASTLRAEARRWEADGGVPRSFYERMGEIGAYAARWPEGARGPGDMAIAELIVREMALSSVGACVAAGTHMEAFYRALARCEYGREIWDDALAGQHVGALGVTERTGGSFPTHCETLAERRGDDWVLNGHKHYCSNMRAATDFVCF